MLIVEHKRYIASVKTPEDEPSSLRLEFNGDRETQDLMTKRTWITLRRCI